MTDPKRWLDEARGGDDESLRLVRLGKTLGPRPGSADRAWTEFLAITGGFPSDPSGGGGVDGGGLGSAGDGGGALAGGAGGATTASGSTAPAVSATLAAGPLVKSLLLGVALGVGGALTSHLIARSSEPSVASQSAEPRLLTAPPPATAPFGDVGQPSASTPAVIAEVAPERDGYTAAAGVRSPPAGGIEPSQAPVATGVVSMPPSTGIASFAVDAEKTANLLQLEAREVADAKALLAQGRARDALALLRRSSTRFPAGTLGQEREVLTIEALSRSGQREMARERALAFVTRFPASPLVERVRRTGD